MAIYKGIQITASMITFRRLNSVPKMTFSNKFTPAISVNANGNITCGLLERGSDFDTWANLLTNKNVKAQRPMFCPLKNPSSTPAKKDAKRLNLDSETKLRLMIRDKHRLIGKKADCKNADNIKTTIKSLISIGNHKHNIQIPCLKNRSHFSLFKNLIIPN